MLETNNIQKNTAEQTDEPEIIEHVPYFNLLMEDIRELNRALREGGGGQDEAMNLLSDIPPEIQPLFWCCRCKNNK